MRIFAAHLLNNYTGSPKVLSQLVVAWVNAGADVRIITSPKTNGFLSGINGAQYLSNHYKYFSNKPLRLINYIASQLVTFIELLFKVKQADLIYINTTLPFSAALIGKIKGCRVIYHLHETSTRPLVLKCFLRWIVQLTSSDIIYVSEFLKNAETFEKKSTCVLPNCLDKNFYATAQDYSNERTIKRNVLMVASQRPYKGIYEFLELARANAHLRFKLVLSESEKSVVTFLNSISKPSNLEIHSETSHMHQFYRWADIILNLSKPNRWIETFGLTVLEGMAYGLPAIVPPIGGIAELVDDGKNGFCISSTNLQLVSEKINLLLSDNSYYKKFSERARSKAKQYTEEGFISKSNEIVFRANA